MQINRKICAYFADNLRINRELSAKFADHPQNLRFRLGFAQTGDAVAFLPLTAFLEQFNAFEAFQNVALGAQSAGALKTTMLSHKIGNFLGLPVRDGTCTTGVDECNRYSRVGLARDSGIWHVSDVVAVPEPIQLHTPSSMRMDDEQLFEFCHANRDYRIERNAEGDILIMSPEAASSGSGNTELTLIFAEWARNEGSGRVFGSSTGFVLPNGAMRSPDVSWVSKKRLQSIAQKDWNRFLPLCPDFVLELRSPSDRLRALQEKMQEYLENGAQLGWLLDAEEKAVHVYRPSKTPEILENPTMVSGEPVLPKFSLEVRRVWTAMEL